MLGVLLVSYPLNKRKLFFLRLILGTAAGFAFLALVGNSIYVRGQSPQAMASHAAIPLITYLLLIGILWFSYDESVWTILFTAATGYIAQDIAGSVKTLFRQIEAVDAFSRMEYGILPVDLLCYGLVYLLLFYALKPWWAPATRTAICSPSAGRSATCWRSWRT